MQKNVLITGAGHRIGKSIALGFAEQGWNVALHFGRSKDKTEAVSAELDALGVESVCLQADLDDPQQTEGLIPNAISALGPLHCLVNNAAHFERDDISDVTAESFNHHLHTNLLAPALLSQAFAKQLPSDIQGNIINIADQRVFNLRPEYLSYTLSKSGLWTLTQTTAMALAPKIRVNAIGPGPTLANTRQTAAQFKQQQRSVPLEYGPTPEEIAKAALFILDAPSMTGEFMALDGGQHLPIAGKGAGEEIYD
jgi:NAD(P)-dependent dehydrogenase (short-subunit alcohol dehydrogenase family)